MVFLTVGSPAIEDVTLDDGEGRMARGGHGLPKVEFPLLLACRAEQCMGPRPEFGDSSIPAGNCGPVSSDASRSKQRKRHLFVLTPYRI
jgi:uncharacterized protein (DUF2141 family)